MRRVSRSPRTCSSWYAAHALPASTSSFVAVLMEQPVLRVIDRRLTPSTSSFRILVRRPCRVHGDARLATPKASTSKPSPSTLALPLAVGSGQSRLPARLAAFGCDLAPAFMSVSRYAEQPLRAITRSARNSGDHNQYGILRDLIHWVVYTSLWVRNPRPEA